MGEPGTKEPLTLEELEASAGVRTGRKHILSILVENKPGVLTRISGLFARRGFNIDTLAVGPTDDEAVSRVTLTLDGAKHPIDQVTKQLHKLVNVIKIRDLEPADTVARELALFKISADGASRGAGSSPAAWGRWASACRPGWAPPSRGPTSRRSSSPATARSR